MSLATTYFIKAQIPAATLQRLLEINAREVQIEGAEITSVGQSTICFDDDSFFPLRRKGKCLRYCPLLGD